MPKFWARRIEFQLENLELTMPDLTIDFNIDFSDGDDGNVGKITIYNLSDDTISVLKSDKQFKLIAGYEDYMGVVLPGIIKEVKTEWERVDKKTTLIVGDNTDAWLNSTINKTWKANSYASQIAPIIADKTGLSIGEISIKSDVKYEKGKTFSTTCRKALQEIAKDTDSKLHSSRGKIYLRPNSSTNKIAFNLTSDTGLISSPVRINKDSEEENQRYSVMSLFNYKIQTDSLIRIKSKTVEGNFRVIEGNHQAEGENFYTKMEVEKIETD
ncbi:MAG: hypothetical protein K9L62_15890 [Vallitaleaceae bacterium]|nr:hypothetical protein [Vallitaleaceae bacterium]